MKHLPLILTCGLLAGCAHYQPQPLVPEKTAAQLESRRLNDDGLKKSLEENLGHPLPTWPETNWNFQELTLVAFYFHPSLGVARAQWLVATAGIKTAGARPNPTLAVTPEYNATTFVPSPWSPAVNFDLPIETMGKRGKRITEAEKVAEAAHWNFVSAAWQIRSGVRNGLLDLQIAGQRAGLLQQQFAAQTEIVRLLQQRFDAGEIARPDLTVAQIAWHKTQQDLRDAQSAKSNADSHLAEALGVTAAALDGVSFEVEPSAIDAARLTSVEARRVVLRSRADILAALADYAAAEADLRLEIAKQFPDVHLNPGYQFDQGDSKWSLGLTLDLPILNQNQGPITEAGARRKLAAAKFIELQAQVIGEIDRAVAGFHLALEQLQTGEKLVAAEMQQQKSAEAQVKAGTGDQLDLLNAQLESATVALSQLDSEAKLQASLGALEDALQCPAGSFAAVVQKISTENPTGKKAHP